MSGGLNLAHLWTTRLGARLLPFADAATRELPLARLLRLSLFQITVGAATALLVGTLNRVMIVELAVPAWLVALMVALPLVFAPFRALIGFRSDHYRSALGWRRVPFIWFGTLMQFGGLAIMPFALLVLAGDGHGPVWVGQLGAALAFLLVGAGLQTTQTAGLALATDVAPESARPRVVALMYVMLLVGMVAASLVFSVLLADFSPKRLVQVIQGAALATLLINMIALWKQEARDPTRIDHAPPRPSFRAAWAEFAQRPGARRFLVAVGLGTAAFNMQDVVLEPYGGEVLHLSVGATSLLTGLLAAGSLAAFALAGRQLARGAEPHRLAAYGATLGMFAFAAVIFAAPAESPALFRLGTVGIGFGGGLFAVGTLLAAMALERDGANGLALGAWGAVQATAAGGAVALGGALRDAVGGLAVAGRFGEAMTTPAAGYGFVYHLELILLFATLAAIGPLARRRIARAAPPAAMRPASPVFGLAELPR
ncbi:MAG: BCD family MFS transporter [Betaproteobacteria bacterium]